MIVDVISNLALYKNIVPGLDKVAEFINNHIGHPLKAGKYILDGEHVFANVQEYETVDPDSVKWENHETYIDLHYITERSEKILWNHAGKLTVSVPYDKEKDVTLYEGPQTGEVNMTEGMFAIFFPGDCHKPRCISGKSEIVKKIMIKLKTSPVTEIKL